MSRVPAIAMAQFDGRLLLFAVAIVAAAALTSFHTFSQARDCRGRARTLRLLLAGACVAVGSWATHFLAIRAYEWGAPTAYDPVMVAFALLAAAVTATAGFALAGPEGRLQAASGGAVIGLGIVLVHVVGMKALDLPASLHRHPLLAVPLHVMAVALCCAACVAYRELAHRRALWVASGLLTVAVCGLHFAAVGAMTVVPDPAAVPAASNVSGPTLAIVVACITAIVMVTARVATLITVQSSREAVLDLRSRHEALQRREEELSRQNLRFDMALTSLPHGLLMVDADRRLVVCNKRYSDMYGIPAELTKPGTPISALVEYRIANDIHAGVDPQAYRDERLGPVTKPTVKTQHLSGGRIVLVSRRPTPDGGWIAVHEDITERRRLQETERETKEALAAVFDAVPAAIICVATDRRVMLWSRGAEHIFGYTAEETVGQPYKLVPHDSKEQFDDLFDRALAGETLRDVHVRRRRKDGSLVDISFSCAAMRDRDGTVRGIVYALDDLTEREKLAARLEAQNELLKQREESLETQNGQFDAALTNMMQGLAMFDAQERLVLSNARYVELFGLAPEEARPGTTLNRIIEQRIAKGFYPGMTAEEVLRGTRERIKGTETGDIIFRPGDGRVISTSIRPRPDSGWIVTLHDISEQEKSQAATAGAERAARRGPEQHVAGPCHVRQRAAAGRLQPALRRNVQAHAGADDARHDGAPDLRVPPGQWLLQVATEIHRQLVARFGERSSRHPRAGRRARDHVTLPAHGQRRTRRHARGHHRAREAERAAEQQHRLLKEQEEKLKAQNVQLDAALNNMVQGLAMFDAEHAHRHRQQSLRGALRPDTGSGEARHALCANHRAAHGQRRSAGQERR